MGDRFCCLFFIVIKLYGILLVVFKAAKHSNIKLPKANLGNLEIYFNLMQRKENLYELPNFTVQGITVSLLHIAKL